jgi:GTPase
VFFDEAKIFVKAGNGGDGCVSFRREKYVPFGGPSGGNGGRGGSVCLLADPGLNTLIDFKKRSHFKAQSGEPGRGKNQFGKWGDDWIIPVPLGTVVRDAATGELLADLTVPSQKVVVARGGHGGRGNATFATSTNQAPRLAERGEPGEERWITLELKSIADVGLVGVPNAGKSTFLAAVSAAHPKIADYPFTTLEPNLGVVTLDTRESFVVADIPGLIEGAHEGAGLGHKFLRHVERTRVIIHLLNGLSADPVADYDQIREELALFNERLASKPELIVFNKMDLPDVQTTWPQVQQTFAARGLEILSISAATGKGVKDVLWRIDEMLKSIPIAPLEPEGVTIFEGPSMEKGFQVTRRGEKWYVEGPEVERIIARTNFDYDEAIERFQHILEGMGVMQALRDAGVGLGETVCFGEFELEWH